MRPHNSTYETGASGSRNLRPLKGLLPFLTPYRRMLVLALLALLVAAGATLSLPVAVRQMIDQGFSEASAETVDRYFLALFGIAAILAFATAARYYVVTWLGERVVADIRNAVAAAAQRFGSVFALVNNSGGPPAGGFDARPSKPSAPAFCATSMTTATNSSSSPAMVQAR